MSALVALFQGAGQPFAICERPVPSPIENSVLVRVTLSTICGSDMHTFSGRRSAPIPCVLGHETVGVVAAPTRQCDAYGQPLREGDRITWNLCVSCGACAYCLNRDLPQKCEVLLKYGHVQSKGKHAFSGGFAEYILLQPGTAIYQLPDSVTDIEAVPLNCALSTVFGGLKLIGVRPKECAVVHGAGILGIYTACYLRESGYRVVVVVDNRTERLQIAEQFGATHTFNLSHVSANAFSEILQNLADGNGVDLVVEASGAEVALSQAVNWLGIGGRCLTLGFVYPNVNATVDAHKIVTKCLTIRGIHNYHPSALGEAVQFMEKIRESYPFRTLVGETFPLAKIDAAFERAMQGDLIRVAIDPRRS